MSIREFRPDRAVEIMHPRYGSGYRIGGRLVLTAAHLTNDVGSVCRIRRKRSSIQENAEDSWADNAEVVWKANGSDIALIELPEHIEEVKGLTLGKLPKGNAGEKIAFQMYGYPLWARTQRGELGKTAAGGRQIEGSIYVSDDSPDGLLVVEAERLPPTTENTDDSEWKGISGAAIVCDGLVVAVQSRHQNPGRPASLEASPLWKVYKDKQWQQLINKHGINTEPEVAAITRAYSALKAFSPIKHKPKIVLMIGLGASVITASLRVLGFFSPLELAFYDLFMRHPFPSTKLQQDNQVTIVGIRDEYLDSWQESEISDQKLLQILKNINEAKPKVVALDIFRDEPQEEKDYYRTLIKYLEEPANNTISTCFSIAESSDKGSEPPFEFTRDSNSLIGFSDIVEDEGKSLKTVRRQLLRMDNPTRECRAKQSLSYRTALTYLESLNIRPTDDELGYIELKKLTEPGEVTFDSIFKNAGGYSSSIDDGGYQILVNFQVEAFQEISAFDVLRATENPEIMKKLENKIVLVGYTSTHAGSANAREDVHNTPIGRVSGVELHAHMVQNILGALYGEHPLIKAFPVEVSLVFIVVCCFGGSIIGMSNSKKVFSVMLGSSITTIFIGYWLAFVLSGWWLPLVPSIAGVLLSVLGLTFIPAEANQHSIQKKR